MRFYQQLLYLVNYRIPHTNGKNLLVFYHYFFVIPQKPICNCPLFFSEFSIAQNQTIYTNYHVRLIEIHETLLKMTRCIRRM